MLTLVVRKGRTAVHWAVECNHPATIDALVKMKADVNIRDGCACVAAFLWLQSLPDFFRRVGYSPLERAGSNKHRECIAVLLAAGAT